MPVNVNAGSVRRHEIRPQTQAAPTARSPGRARFSQPNHLHHWRAAGSFAGGPRPIETAEALLAHFEGDLHFPTAITADLHARLEPNEAERAWGQSYDGRLWDVLWIASLGARKAGRADRVSFQVILAEVDERHPRKTRQNTLTLWCVIGPGDQGEPVITIGFPQDF